MRDDYAGLGFVLGVYGVLMFALPVLVFALRLLGKI